jgi:hypothetical protein
MTKESYIITETITRYVITPDDMEEAIREKYDLPKDAEFNWDLTESLGPLYITVRQKEEHKEPDNE